jgi:hypothetical protein
MLKGIHLQGPHNRARMLETSCSLLVAAAFALGLANTASNSQSSATNSLRTHSQATPREQHMTGTEVMAPSEEPRTQGSIEPRKVEVRFVKSPIADYLFYLLYRSTGDFPKLKEAVVLDNIPKLDELISLPEIAASAQINSYGELQSLLLPYRDAHGRVAKMIEGGVVHYRILAYSNTLPSYERLSHILALGAADYPKFLAFWEREIAPEEDKQIAAWREQLAIDQPFEKLQLFARLRFPAKSVDIAAIALHVSGSANTYPEGIYSGLFPKPNLAWTVGHEGTHLLVDEHAGLNWLSYPQAREAMLLVKGRGGAQSDIEEALCLLMQVKVSQASGRIPADYRLSARFTEPAVKRDILVALEDGWQKYQESPSGNLIDFLLTQTVCALSRLPPDQR